MPVGRLDEDHVTVAKRWDPHRSGVRILVGGSDAQLSVVISSPGPDTMVITDGAVVAVSGFAGKHHIRQTQDLNRNISIRSGPIAELSQIVPAPHPNAAIGF